MRFLFLLALLVALAASSLALNPNLMEDAEDYLNSYPANAAPIIARDSSNPHGEHYSMDPTTGDDPTGFVGEDQEGDADGDADADAQGEGEDADDASSSGQHQSAARGKAKAKGKGRATHKKSNEGSRRNRA